ncbi:unnamed protein product [Haemonchus placei]|uniref:PDZ domain-containing protein n=1 Tax=Haemonchus placei TaxID=6290 RepID=A0A158QP29_HAEPC|nr:unnamed protein product [Haemonchus placei]
MPTKTALCAASLEEHMQRITNSNLSAQITPSTVSPSASQDETKEVVGPRTSGGHAISSPASTAHDRPPSEVPTTTETPTRKTPPPSTSPSSSTRRTSTHVDEPATSQTMNEPSSRQHPKSLPLDQMSSDSRRSSSTKVRKPVPNGSAVRATTAQSPETPALTVFLRENWQNTNYETIDVKLLRDPALGLGITVAGYVHRKVNDDDGATTTRSSDVPTDMTGGQSGAAAAAAAAMAYNGDGNGHDERRESKEIGGIFVKSLVPRSAAAQSGSIRVHDLILEVNGVSLEHLSHADSVRTLVKSGEHVQLRLIRFPVDSAQAQCLRMLQEQETETQVIDVQSSNPSLVAEWKRKLSDDVDIITTIIRPDSNRAGDGGLGISLEGTVDVVQGHQLCPHHYIESIRHNGPAAASGMLQAGDELLQVNHSILYGESHVTIRQALSRAVHSGAPVTLVVARRTQHVNVFQPTSEKSLPASYPLLASGHEKIVKAKSEINIPDLTSNTDALLQQVSRRLRARSLEPLTGLAVWNCVPLVVCLEKDERGLGFSIVDYQDPLHPGESVIVVQSLVPGGLAQSDGRIVPGDRLLFVNQHDLSNSR